MEREGEREREQQIRRVKDEHWKDLKIAWV
jgi:hypothetical protein